MKAEKMIKITPKIRVELMKEFPVSEKTVYNALTFATGSYTADQIRRRALELGGKEWMTGDEVESAEASFCPDCTVAKYPPCDKDIPCCRCEKKQTECNSWQPCPKNERIDQ